MSQRFTGLKVLAAAAVVGLGAFTSSAEARTKDLSMFGWTAEMDPGVDLTVLNQVGDTLTLQLEKFATFTAIKPLTITFQQTAVTAQSVSRIIIDDEHISNQTGQDWNGFKFIVESTMGPNDVLPSFDTAASGGFTTGTQFGTQNFASNNELDVSGGMVSGSAFPAGLYSPGANGDLVINASPFSTGNVKQTFVFKELPLVGTGGNGGGGGGTPPPVIPLPAAAWTSLTGLLGLGLISNAKNLKKILS